MKTNGIKFIFPNKKDMVKVLSIFRTSAKDKVYMYCRNEKRRWLFSTIFVMALFAISYAILPVRFETNDDVGMMYILAGYYTGDPAVGTLYSNIIRDYIISGVYTLFPGIPWYSLIMVGMLVLSNILILKSFLRICIWKGITIWRGIVGYLLFYYLYLQYSVISMQFTTSAVIAGGAGLALIYAGCRGEKRSIRGVDSVIAALMITAAYIIRKNSGYVVIAWALLVMILRLWEEKNRKELHRYLLVICLISIILIGGAWKVNQKFYSSSEWRDYQEYNIQRSHYKDYPHLVYDEAEEIYEEINWSKELYNLANEWFFMDRAVNTEAFRFLNESYEKGEPSKLLMLEENCRSLLAFCKNNPVVLLQLLGIGLFVAIGILIKKPKVICVMFVSVILLSGMMLYLAFFGRIVLRALQAAIIPCAICLSLLILEQAVVIRGYTKRVFLVVMSSIFICLSLGVWSETRANALSVDYRNDVKAKKQIEDYCEEHSDQIYIYEIGAAGTMVSPWTCDREKPINVISWGGTSMFSPLYYEKLEYLGKDQLYSDVFFDEDVYFVYTSDGTLEELTNYLMRNYQDVHVCFVDKIGECKVVKFE